MAVPSRRLRAGAREIMNRRSIENKKEEKPSEITQTEHEERLKTLEGKRSTSRNPSKNKTITDLFIEAKDEGFFSQKRRPAEILHKLAEKGHTYKRVESLTGPLQKATKQGVLKREKSPNGWVYFT